MMSDQFAVKVDLNKNDSLGEDRNARSKSLTFSQERLFYMHKLIPNNTSLNFQFIVEISGNMHLSLFELCFNEIVSRFDVLRSNYSLDGIKIVAKVSDHNVLTMEKIDVGPTEFEQLATIIDHHLSQDGSKAFDLANEKLFRCKIISVGKRKHYFLFTGHHIIIDVMSVDFMISKIADLYSDYLERGRIQWQGKVLQFHQLANKQRKELTQSKLNRLRSFWKEQFDTPLKSLKLDMEGNSQFRKSIAGERSVVKIPPRLEAKIESLCHKKGIEVSSYLLAAYKILLHRYTEQDQIIIGYSFKEMGTDKSSDTIGCFINPLPILSDFSLHDNPMGYVMYLNDLKARIRENSELPFQDIVENLGIQRDGSRDPLFSYMFEYHRVNTAHIRDRGISMEITSIDSEVNNHTSRLDLTLEIIHRGNGIHVAFEYSTERYSREAITRVHGHYLTLLESMSHATNNAISTLNFLTEDERDLLVNGWNRGSMIYTPNVLIHALFEKKVSEYYDKTALIYKGRTLTYDQLNKDANKLARYLALKGIKRGDFVGIYLQHTMWVPIAFLSVMKLGAVCVPIDPHLPENRIKMILDDCQAKVIITHEPLSSMNFECVSIHVNLDLAKTEINGQNDTNLRIKISEEDLAVIFYTSGTTGKPKGVMVYHKGRGNLLRWEINTFKLTPHRKYLLKTSISAGVLVKEMFWPLLTGSMVVIADHDKRQSASYLATLIRQHEIDVITCVPTLLNLLLEEEISRCNNLKYIFCSGENLSDELKNKCLKKLPACLVNTFGMNEISTITHEQFKGVLGKEKQVTLGQDSSVNLVLLDRNREIVPIGIPGEICVSGTGLAKGYLNRPELNQKKFFSLPHENSGVMFGTGDKAYYMSDGRLIYSGRSDHQVKIRGNRVEIKEINVVLQKHPSVKESIVVCRKDDTGQNYLSSYVVLNGNDATIQEIRRFFRHRLPDYMIPEVTLLESMPKTEIGKINVNMLPEPKSYCSNVGESEAPETETEKKIAGIWAKILKIDVSNIKKDDNYFDIGGDSLKSIQAATMIEIEFGVEISLELIMNADLSEIGSYLKNKA